MIPNKFSSELMNKAAELNDDEAVKIINGSHTLLSFLYDLDLLPEQLTKGSDDWMYMKYVVVAFQRLHAELEAKNSKAT